MNFLDSEVYENIDNPEKWIAIITTDYTETDEHYQRIKKDVENIKLMLTQLGFRPEKIFLFHNKAKNVISKRTSDCCTFDGSSNDGYIMMFNLTYKIEDNTFRAGQSWYTSHDIHEIFTVNNLYEWSSKPKLIFNQNSLLKPKTESSKTSNIQLDSSSGSPIEIPINMDIFESFSGAGDSYGDENGSFYIQALCETINQNIKQKMNKDITDIMYEVHAKINEMVGKDEKMGKQTPFYKTTHVKNFVFPLAKTGNENLP